MEFPKLSIEKLIERIQAPKGKIRMVLDTDTYNEVDDQFALAYALRSPESMTVEAIYAAPFLNDRSKSPEEGMEKSYDEILKILKLLKVPQEGSVYRGSRNYLKDSNTPQESEAARDLVKKAMTCGEEPLYVVAIGAITNVASAILIEPKIIEKIVVVWLGGNEITYPHTMEFNLMQDIHASRLIFDCGVPLIHLPCNRVTTHLLTTVPELEYYLKGKSEIGTYLTEIVSNYKDKGFAWSKVIWDIVTIAWLINPEWVSTIMVHSPILTDHLTWSFDSKRHFISTATELDRDKIFGDLFKKLAE
ncbi:MAG TPA: nucleoside hydrolase [Clostridiaceae bacterium]